jgi:hypothetical protein
MRKYFSSSRNNLSTRTTMKPGQVYRTFTAKDGQPVTLRTPQWSDLDDLLALINGLVEEGADIIRDQHIPREQEAE